MQHFPKEKIGVFLFPVGEKVVSDLGRPRLVAFPEGSIISNPACFFCEVQTGRLIRQNRSQSLVLDPKPRLLID